MENSNAPTSGGRSQATSLEDALSQMDAELFASGAASTVVPGGTCPDTYEAALPRYDEDTQVVMGLLWMAFASGAATASSGIGALDVTHRALALGSEKMRGYVYDQVVTTGDTGGGWVPALEGRWRSLGARAMGRAEMDAGSVIDFGHFDTAWSASKPVPDRPPHPLSNPLDTATELIGTHLWFHFQLGALFGSDLPYDTPEGIVRRGRALSRYWVRHNAVKWDVVDGQQIDYSKWPWAMVADCATKAGRRANRDAVLAGASSITSDHFESAWCSVHAGMVRVAERAGLELGTLSAACG